MIKVDKETYMKAFKNQKLKPVSSFTDLDGVLPFGYGIPAMDTDWGAEDSDIVIARSEARKKSRLDLEWEYTYYLNNTEYQLTN
jgi:hypothetical protein